MRATPRRVPGQLGTASIHSGARASFISTCPAWRLWLASPVGLSVCRPRQNRPVPWRAISFDRRRRLVPASVSLFSLSFLWSHPAVSPSSAFCVFFLFFFPFLPFSSHLLLPTCPPTSPRPRPHLGPCDSGRRRLRHPVFPAVLCLSRATCMCVRAHGAAYRERDTLIVLCVAQFLVPLASRLRYRHPYAGQS